MVAGLRVMAVVGALPKRAVDPVEALGAWLASPPAAVLRAAVLRAHRRRDGSGAGVPWQACLLSGLQTWARPRWEQQRGREAPEAGIIHTPINKLNV